MWRGVSSSELDIAPLISQQAGLVAGHPRKTGPVGILPYGEEGPKRPAGTYRQVMAVVGRGIYGDLMILRERGHFPQRCSHW